MPAGQQHKADNQNDNRFAVHAELQALLKAPFPQRSRHRIFAAAAPGMTAADTFYCEPGPPQCPVQGDRFQRVIRAAWLKPAMGEWPENEGLGGRDHPTVKLQAENNGVLRRVHVPLRHFNNPAFRRLVKKSHSTSVNPLPAIEGRATRIRSSGCTSSCWCCRKLSRNNLRARLRSTAPPTLEE